MAERRRARETGKRGPKVRHRGKAAWPHARRTAGPFSPATHEAEQGRPLGIASEVQLIGEHVRADFDILSLKVNSAGLAAVRWLTLDVRFSPKLRCNPINNPADALLANMIL